MSSHYTDAPDLDRDEVRQAAAVQAWERWQSCDGPRDCIGTERGCIHCGGVWCGIEYVLAESDRAFGGAEREDAHTADLRVDQCGAGIVVHCHYDKADTARPCWPVESNGEQEPAPSDVCTWEQWAEAVGVEVLNEWRIEGLPVTAEWEGWDSPSFTLGAAGSRRVQELEAALKEVVNECDKWVWDTGLYVLEDAIANARRVLGSDDGE